MSRGLAFEVSGVSRRFGSKAVLTDFNLAGYRGEFVAIVGHSGSGKSTFLRLLAGLDQADRGTIRVGTEVLAGICPVARMMFQDGRLLPWLRVGENVGLGLPAADRSRIKEMLTHVGLIDRINDWPGILSGGQKQRVALARALAARPDLLLLDEPLGSLDALTRLEMQRLIESLWQESGTTAVLITHDVDEAVALADRVILLQGGRAEGEWRIDLPRPRDRADGAFTALVQDIVARVMGEVVVSPRAASRSTRLAETSSHSIYR